MLIFLITLASSCLMIILIIQSKNLHAQFSADSDLVGIQKFHQVVVPRIGGLGIAFGLLLGFFISFKSHGVLPFYGIILGCAMMVFTTGLVEDLRKDLSVQSRLFFVTLSSGIAIYLLNCPITRLDLPGIDLALSYYPVAYLFTIFAVLGVTNAYNIIDGFHGLSSMIGMMTLLALGLVSLEVQDSQIAFLSFSMLAATLGFFIFNFPKGLIFLGDGGAYLIGFWIAVLSVMICSNHQEISPWFALLVNAYPICETIFSIYRRKLQKRKNAGHPDGIHLHSLIFRRILKNKKQLNDHDWFSANAKTSPYLWILSAFSIVPSILFWYSTPILFTCFTFFATSYCWFYRRIVTFRTPKLTLL